MTSVMNLPACYHITYAALFDAYIVCYQEEMIGIIKGREEAEQIARVHFMNANETTELIS